MMCAEYNAGITRNGGSTGFCVAVTLVESAGQFCYLKNSTGINNTDTGGTGPYVSAQLLL
jgi:hypothetical protein